MTASFQVEKTRHQTGFGSSIAVALIAGIERSPEALSLCPELVRPKAQLAGVRLVHPQFADENLVEFGRTSHRVGRGRTESRHLDFVLSAMPKEGLQVGQPTNTHSIGPVVRRPRHGCTSVE